MTQIDVQQARQCQDALARAGISLPLLKTDGPVFAQPWQAQAFALTLALHDRRLFTWEQWAQTLSASIQQSQSNGDPDDGQTYYHHWLAALEAMAIKADVLSLTQIEQRQEGWRQAALRTPHGQPIELSDHEKNLSLT